MPINPNYTIYKPNKDFVKGAATCWEFNPKTKTFWLKAAKQKRDKNKNDRPIFDWDGSSLMNLAIPDLTDILCLFSGQKEFLGQSAKANNPYDKGSGLYHQDKKGNTVLKIYRRSAPKSDFILEFSSKKPHLFRVAHLISIQEAMMLLTIIQRVVWQMFLGGNSV
jgi:hypothetical protein